MRYFISHNTALSFWLSPSGSAGHLRARTLPSTDDVARPADYAGLFDTAFSGHSVDVITASGAPRPDDSRIRMHTAGSLPSGSFVKLDKGLYVASPELAIIQCAATRPIAHTVKDLYQLCGNYVIDDYDARGFSSRENVTSTKAIDAYLKRVGKMNGVQAARRALAYATDSAASPMETSLAMLMSMSVLLGGYGFPVPSMNAALSLSGTSGCMASTDTFYCDLYWPESKLALEYDSDAFHTGAERIAQDSKRRNALEFSGVSVIAVTSRQIMNDNELGKIARLAAKKMGKRLRSEALVCGPARRALRDIVLPNRSLHD